MQIAVVIPVYNEEALLAELVSRVDDVSPPESNEGPCTRRIIIVDDGSTDGTGTVIKQLASREDVTAISHEHNKGKGAAVRSGFAAALEAGADVVIVQDADLEYDPLDHDLILGPILDGRADAVIGSRFIGQTHRVLYFWHYMANRFITLVSNVFTNLNLSDIECCFKAFRREVLENLDLNEDRFGIEPEIISKLSRMRLKQDSKLMPIRIYEVGVSYSGRTYEEGKKITWRDGIAALWCIVKYALG